MLQKYEEYYSAEEELNNQLNVFAINYSMVYGGYNDVKTQLGFSSDNGMCFLPDQHTYMYCIPSYYSTEFFNLL